MKFIIHDYITKEISAIYNSETEEIQTFGRFEVSQYGHGAEPVVNLFEDGTTILVENNFIIYPEYLDNNEEYEEPEDD